MTLSGTVLLIALKRGNLPFLDGKADLETSAKTYWIGFAAAGLLLMMSTIRLIAQFI